MSDIIRIALVQMMVSDDKTENLRNAEKMTRKAVQKGAQIVILPEMFVCPYETRKCIANKEKAGETIWKALSRIASENRVYLVGGSFPEEDGEKLYNTCFVFDDSGNEIARHRKAHLFDVDIKGGQYYKESSVFAPGDDICIFEAFGHKFGVAICFDIRFPEYFMKLTLEGAEAVIVPASFNMTTGPMHWELSFRMRAVDNQIYTAGTAPARNEAGKYVSYANSIVCDPWGKKIADGGTDENIITADLDMDIVRSAREQLPILNARREELYR